MVRDHGLNLRVHGNQERVGVCLRAAGMGLPGRRVSCHGISFERCYASITRIHRLHALLDPSGDPSPFPFEGKCIMSGAW